MHVCLDCAPPSPGAVPLHWPLVDAPGRMVELLGRQELERKRIEDGRAHLITLPGHRWAHAQAPTCSCRVAWRRRRGGCACTGCAHPSSPWQPLFCPSEPLLFHAAPRYDAESRALQDFERLWAAAAAKGPSGDPSGRGGGSQSAGGAAAGAALLSRYYLWAQTDAFVHVAAYDPLGGRQKY